MDNEPEVIRQQMDETRAALTDKLETLEQQVVQTVQGATTAVAETVETVKDAVQGTVSTVQETVHKTFDLSGHVDRHPWAMLAGSVALGYLAGRMVGRRAADQGNGTRSVPLSDSSSSHWPAVMPSKEQGYRPREEGNGRGAATAREPAGPGWLAGMGDAFGPEIHQLKGLALGTMLSLVRDLVSQSAPEQLRPQLADVMNRITVKLGGEPIQGPLVERALPPSHLTEGGAHEGCDPTEMGRAMGSARLAPAGA